MAGAIGGAFVSVFAGHLLEYFKNAGHIGTGYTIMFTIAASTYILAWIIMNVFAPKVKKVVID
jgi:ACS family hexuronate transporter-like MFS transporter